MEFTFSSENIAEDGTTSTVEWSISIPPEVYLIERKGGGCQTLISSGNDSTGSIILGEPFLVNTTI